MTKAEQMEQELSDMGVSVVRLQQLGRQALALADGLVVLGAVDTQAQEHTLLAHEKNHFKLGAFYTPDAPIGERRRAEARVDRAAILELVPKAVLAGLLRRGLSVEEIADLLEVTDAQIWSAYRYYRDADPHFCRGCAR